MVETMQEQVLQEKIKSFVMPKLQIGDPVLWHSGGQYGSGSRLAHVREIGQRNIGVSISIRGVGVKEISGVFHKDDPMVSQAQMADAGTWSKSPMLLRIEALEERVATLEQLT